MTTKIGARRGCECRVTLAELAAVAGTTGDAIVTRLDSVEPDWAGRPSVTPAAARALLDTLETEKLDHARLAAEHRAYLDDREVARRDTAERARTAAVARFRAANPIFATVGPGLAVDPVATVTPAARNAGNEAYAAAIHEYDRQHPELALEQWKTAR